GRRGPMRAQGLQAQRCDRGNEKAWSYSTQKLPSGTEQARGARWMMSEDWYENSWFGGSVCTPPPGNSDRRENKRIVEKAIRKYLKRKGCQDRSGSLKLRR